MDDFSRLCIHTITTKPLRLDIAIGAYQQIGAGGITVWRDALIPLGLQESARLLTGSGLEVVSLCRGGFFPSTSAGERQKALDENRRVIDEAVALGAPLIVLVCGAAPGQSLQESRGQIEDAIAALIPYCEQANVRLGIEPLHPMYADTRSAINTLAQANDIIQRLGSPYVGATIDVYHVWWDDRLETEIARCGKMNAIFSFHVCDWRCPTRDLLNDRGLMGCGCVPIRQIRQWVEQAGFHGMIEVEIFSDELWKGDQMELLQQIQRAYRECV
ncbi:MAG TPA: sugar phosphate isomerase/epimerase family protein [Tepidisphaeraceae bacterium]|jgi:sugar phosphate isomerase/epimerase